MLMCGVKKHDEGHKCDFGQTVLTEFDLLVLTELELRPHVETEPMESAKN